MEAKYLYLVLKGDYNYFTKKINQYIEQLQEVGKKAHELDFEFDVIRILFPLDATEGAKKRLGEDVSDTKYLIERNKEIMSKCQVLQNKVDEKYKYLEGMDKNKLEETEQIRLEKMLNDKKVDLQVEQMREEVLWQDSEAISLSEELQYWKGLGMGLKV